MIKEEKKRKKKDLMKVYRFWSLFGLKSPNELVTKVTIRIGQVQLFPGAVINRGITIEGVDLFALAGKNLQVHYVNNVYTIVGVQNG